MGTCGACEDEGATSESVSSANNTANTAGHKRHEAQVATTEGFTTTATRSTQPTRGPTRGGGKECQDTEGETDISIEDPITPLVYIRRPATCAQLAPFCQYVQFDHVVSKRCPKTCGACEDEGATSESVSSANNTANAAGHKRHEAQVATTEGFTTTAHEAKKQAEGKRMHNKKRDY